jgi:uncharacterized repeat protein (TIGR04052 family)
MKMCEGARMILNPRPKSVLRVAALVIVSSFGVAACDDEDGDGTTAQQDAGPAGEAGRGGRVSTGGTGGSKVEDGKRAVTIEFRGALADRDFSCLDEYENVGSTRASAVPVDFRFYVQDLKLIDEGGEEVPVELDTRAPWQTQDVALIDFEDMKGSCRGTPETNTRITGRVPEGEYVGVTFRNGVPEELNHLDQSTQPAPLDVTDLYWSWLSGYRFVVAEVARPVGSAPEPSADDADAGVEQGVGMMHIGSTACRKDQGCTKKNRNLVRLSDFDPSRDVIVADLAGIFEDTDVTRDNTCHGADEACAAMFENFGVRYEDGESLDEQKVYKVAAAR